MKTCQWAKLVVWLNNLECFSSSSSFGSVLFFFSVQSIHTNCFWLDLTNKKNFSDWRQKHGEKWPMLTTFFLTATAAITGSIFFSQWMSLLTRTCKSCKSFVSSISFSHFFHPQNVSSPQSFVCFIFFLSRSLHLSLRKSFVFSSSPSIIFCYSERCQVARPCTPLYGNVEYQSILDKRLFFSGQG